MMPGFRETVHPVQAARRFSGGPALKRQRELEQKNMNEIYCDGVSHVILSRGLVSIEYFHLVYDDKLGKHKREPFFTLSLIHI